MADERIEDITGGELTAFAADDKFVILDKSDTTDDADGTVKYIEPATLGLLESATGSDADTTMAVGTMYHVDMSAWATTVRTYRLPSTAAVGDRIGIAITAGNATHELAIRTVAASNDTINGVDHDASDWSKLFITGEVVIFRCVTANSAWVVEHDGRIPCTAELRRDAAQSINSATITKIAFDAEGWDVGDIGDEVTNDRFDIRRAGRYHYHAAWYIPNLDDTESALILIYKNGSSVRRTGQRNSSTGNAHEELAQSGCLDLADGDYIEFRAYHSEGASQNTSTAADWRPCMQLVEVL